MAGVQGSRILDVLSSYLSFILKNSNTKGDFLKQTKS